MRCYICDKEDDLITFDRVKNEFNPCNVCLAAIEECLEAFDDIEAVTEDFVEG